MSDPMNMHGRAPLICLLATPESSVAALTGFFEVFSVLEPTWVELTGETAFRAAFDVRIVALSNEPLRYPGGASIVPQATLAETAMADAVIVTDLMLDPEADTRERWPDAGEWLRRIYTAGGMICSVCNGSVMLASAGLLDNRPATTHWGFVDHFKTYFPSVALRPERVLVTVPPDERIVTAGGMSSWQDLAIYIVARFYGEAVAIKAAKLFLFGDRSEGQLLYAAMSKPKRHEDAVIAACQEWLGANYATP
ncbi:MAG: DJ-1/PfpI family protein, partial [Pseudomonadota bacterium]